MASPGPHSYLVLRDQAGEGFPQGLLVALKGNKFGFHSHFLVAPSGSGFIPADDLAGLTEEECVLLDAVGHDYTTRYAVYSTPGKLQWGVGLQVWDIVLARLPEETRRKERGSGRGSTQGGGEEYATAIIRWKGMTKYGKHCFGVEIMVSDVRQAHWLLDHSHL